MRLSKPCKAQGFQRAAHQCWHDAKGVNLHVFTHSQSPHQALLQHAHQWLGTFQARWKAHEADSSSQLLDICVPDIAPQLLEHDISRLEDLHHACIGPCASALHATMAASGTQHL